MPLPQMLPGVLNVPVRGGGGGAGPAQASLP